MPVIAHRTVARQTLGKSLDPLGQNLLKSRKILVFAEYPQPTAGTVQYVIYNICFGDSFGSWHDSESIPSMVLDTWVCFICTFQKTVVNVPGTPWRTSFASGTSSTLRPAARASLVARSQARAIVTSDGGSGGRRRLRLGSISFVLGRRAYTLSGILHPDLGRHSHLAPSRNEL
jgi:hypothetical protein